MFEAAMLAKLRTGPKVNGSVLLIPTLGAPVNALLSEFGEMVFDASLGRFRSGLGRVPSGEEASGGNSLPFAFFKTCLALLDTAFGQRFSSSIHVVSHRHV